MFRSLFLTLTLLLSAPAWSAALELPVKPGALNRITFNAPFSTLVMSPNAPLSSQPTNVGDNRTIIMEVAEGAQSSFQLFAQLSNGEVVELLLTPDVDALPLSWSQRGGDIPMTKQQKAASIPFQRPGDAAIERIFYEAALGNTPDGFVPVKPPVSGQVGDLFARYVAAFKSDAYALLVMTLHSDQLRWISEPDLYIDGVKAVMIDGDRVGVNDAPLAYILMTGDLR